MSLIADVIQSTVAIAKGMKRTMSEIPRKKWTVQYPEEPVTLQPRYRGQHLLHVDENGKEKCVACYLCAAACPSDCIYIEAIDDPRPYGERVGRDERYAKVYNIDYGRCIFCGFCVEACPEDAIRMAKETPNLPDFDRENMWGNIDLLKHWQPAKDPAKPYPDAPPTSVKGHP